MAGDRPEILRNFTVVENALQPRKSRRAFESNSTTDVLLHSVFLDF